MFTVSLLDPKMDVFMFKCPIFLQPFEPPLFKCKVGHFGCGRCAAELPGNWWKQCEQSVIDAVVSAPLTEAHMIQCPNVGCGTLAASNGVNDHYMACLQGPYGCIEPGCDFTSWPQDILLHLGGSHSIPVFKFKDGVPTWCMTQALVQPLGRTFFCVVEDGGVFLMLAGPLGPVTVVSFVCVRSAACLWPRYTVEVLAIGPPSPAGTIGNSTDMDTLMAVIEPTSTASPGAISFNELTSFLAVPPHYEREAGPHKQVAVIVCIKRKIVSSSDPNSKAMP